MKKKFKFVEDILENVSPVKIVESKEKKLQKKELKKILENKIYSEDEEKIITQFNVENLFLDSREVTGEKDVFFATEGVNIDRKDYIDDVIKKGCRNIFCSEIPESILKKLPKDNWARKYKDITFVVVKNLEKKVGIIAENFYDNPSRDIKVIGITGTNGKTTIAFTIYNILKKMNQKVALFSTIENIIGDKKEEAENTTPDPISISKKLREAVDQKCNFLVMEVSSHAAEQGRISGIEFDGALFTNFTQDHLRFHKTMDNYFKAKKSFFDSLSEEAIAVTNYDDKFGKKILEDTKARKISYAAFDNNFLSKYSKEEIGTSYFFKNQRMKDKKTEVVFTNKKNDRKINLQTIGEFNVYNMLSVYTLLAEMGFDRNLILNLIQEIKTPKGRMETVAEGNRKNILAIVDYAHTPDALENILETLSKVKDKNARVILVMGAGGDRDKTKRPIMGKKAVDGADFVFFTTDNPRTENATEILNDIVLDLDAENFAIEERRSQAILKAVQEADSGDIVVVAGKGHEEYQIIGHKKYYFSDKEELEKALL